MLNQYYFDSPQTEVTLKTLQRFNYHIIISKIRDFHCQVYTGYAVYLKYIKNI